MNTNSATAESVSRWTPVATAAGASGFGLTAGGVLLGIYSRVAASTVPLDEDGVKGKDIFGSFSDEPIHGVPERFGIAAVILGVLVLAVVVGAVVYRSRRPNSSRGEGFALLALLLTLVALPYMAASSHLPGVYALIRLDYPYFSRLPTAVGACGLVFAGAVLQLGTALGSMTVTVLRRRVVVLLMSLGLLASAGIGATAVRAGDDRLNANHSTTTHVAIPPVPEKLGTERYRVSKSDFPKRTAMRDIVVAGAGFVVATQEGLTAYDGLSGKPRWRYVRTNVERDRGRGVAYVDGSCTPPMTGRSCSPVGDPWAGGLSTR
ncbi:hypothetical protein [Nocardia abscessus]|uniref:hypothetical protein n=1 Tax=Nocardia abscessus TaxID=120957 RepID=UPI0012FC207B|nr:hypothetical protein [Nocardia abscessus]MCC3333408.1 hypothetical protein [Nocardia abscessus]